MFWKKKQINIYEALLNFQNEVPSLKRNATNDFHNSRYADLHEVVTTINPILRKHGLFFMQPLEFDGKNQVLKTIISNTDGSQTIQSSCVIQVHGLKPEGIASNITYMRRNSLVTLLGLI